MTSDPRTYFSFSDGKWRVISDGSPLCRDGDRAQAEACAARFKINLSGVPVWNGDAGRFEVDHADSK